MDVPFTAKNTILNYGYGCPNHFLDIEEYCGEMSPKVFNKHSITINF